MTKRDFYHILGVERDAEPEEIKKAYRNAALKYHPDRNPGDQQAEENFKLASEAYEVLSDPEQRSRYDQFGHAGLAGTGFHHFTDVEDIFASFGDLFEDFFGFRQQGRSGRRPRGADLSCEIAISLQEASTGIEKNIQVSRRETCVPCGGSGAKPGSSRKTCSRCRGSGQVGKSQGFFMITTTCGECHGVGTVLDDPCHECRGEGRVRKSRKLSVKIPPGVDQGTQMLLSGEGEAGQEGAATGDLYLFIQVQKDPHFARDGDTLYTELPVSMVTAVLGGETEVQTLEGFRKVQIPRGSETGQQLVLEGLGFPRLRSRQRGDLVVRLRVKTPQHLTRKQEELLRQFAAESGEKITKKKGFFS